MSDREIVTIDAHQFDALKTQSDTLNQRIGPADEGLSLHQVLTHLETTLFNGLKALVAASGSGNSADVLSAINNLDRKVDIFMATQEERLQAILTAVQTVKQMLADLKTSNPAIEDEITAIEAELAPAEAPDGGGDPGTTSRTR